MRLAVVTAVVAFVAGLNGYEFVLLSAATVSIVLGLVNWVRLARAIKDIRALQADQGRRIDNLPPIKEQ